MTTTKPFYECQDDALIAAIPYIGGYKAVAKRFWPDMHENAAEDKLRSQLKQERRERLSSRQVILIKIWCNEAGYHGYKHWEDSACGYHPSQPISHDGETTALLTELREIAAIFQRGNERGERIMQLLARLDADTAKLHKLERVA